MRIRGVRAMLVLALLGAAFGPAEGQQGQTVRGTVVATDGMRPLAAASVRVQGTNQGTITNAQGQYTLNGVPANATLVVSLLGFGAAEVPVEGRAVVDVSLAAAAVNLEGLVVVGYTTQTQRTIAGSVASVAPEALQERKSAVMEDGLKGRVAGVNIQTSGEPGQAAQINIRGANFLQNTAPLYVVDGMYLRQNPNLNPNDIASIQVLKDASAASQYGAQAANGVVVITTKKGLAGDQNRMEIRSYYGFQQPGKTMEMANSAEWAEITRQAFSNSRAQNPSNAPPPQGVLDVLSGKNTIDTNWQDEILQNGSIQDHTLAMSGGTENASYFVSGGYTAQDGTVMSTAFERYTVRANSELRRGRLTLGENISLARSDRELMDGTPLFEAMRMVPAIAVRDPANASTGGWGYGTPDIPTFGNNPVGELSLRDNRQQANQAVGTLYGAFELFEDVNYRVNLGFNFNEQSTKDFRKLGQIRQNTVVDFASLSNNIERDQSLLIENLLNVNRTFGNHSINATGGITSQRTTNNLLTASRRNFPDENLQQINAGIAEQQNSGRMLEAILQSYLGRANYNYAEKYLTEFSFRRDGSSRFGPTNRWGNFYAGSVGWVMSEEPFFRSIPLLGSSDYFKIRASYGTLGNQDFDDYQYAASVAANRGYIFGTTVVPGSIQVDLANPDIKWQENTMQNYGFDLNLLNSLLTITGDYYISKSSDLLVQAPLPFSVGSASAPFVNAGEVQNSGIELGVVHRLAKGDFRLDTSLNLTTTKNEVLTLGNGAQPIFAGSSNISRTAVGYPMSHFWAREVLGIFQSPAEVTAHTTTVNGAPVVIQPTARPGDIIYADLSGPAGVPDGTITDHDRGYAGSPWPDLEGGFFLDGGFKAFEFNIGLRGASGFQIYNSIRQSADRMDDVNNFTKGLSPWTPENPSNVTPRALYGGLGAINARGDADRWIEQGDYLKLQNIQVAYNLPGSLFQSVGISTERARVYVNLQNVKTWTAYTGYDPEFVGSGGTGTNFTLARGVDSGRIYPNPRTFSLGIDLGF